MIYPIEYHHKPTTFYVMISLVKFPWFNSMWLSASPLAVDVEAAVWAEEDDEEDDSGCFWRALAGWLAGYLGGWLGGGWLGGYIHACIHTSIHTSIHQYIHTSIHTPTYTYIHTHAHTDAHIHMGEGGEGGSQTTNPPKRNISPNLSWTKDGSQEHPQNTPAGRVDSMLNFFCWQIPAFDG